MGREKQLAVENSPPISKKKGLRPSLIAWDVHRPAAYEQLHQIADRVEVPFYGDKNSKDAVKVIKESGLKYEVGGMSTTVEVPDLDTLFDLVKKAEAAEINVGAKRILINIKIDHRMDKDITINSKRTAVTGES